MGLPSKNVSPSTICLEKDETLSFDSKPNAEIFRDFYSNLSSDLLKKLLSPPNKFGKEAVKKYYENINVGGKSFSLRPTTQASVLKLLEEVNPSKSAGIDNLAGKFLKEGAPAFSSPITDLCNLSISLSSFPDDCKIAKLLTLQERSQNKAKKTTIGLSLYFP